MGKNRCVFFFLFFLYVLKVIAGLPVSSSDFYTDVKIRRATADITPSDDAISRVPANYYYCFSSLKARPSVAVLA